MFVHFPSDSYRSLSIKWLVFNSKWDKLDSLILWSDILLNVFLAIAVDNLAGGGGQKKAE